MFIGLRVSIAECAEVIASYMQFCNISFVPIILCKSEIGNPWLK